MSLITASNSNVTTDVAPSPAAVPAEPGIETPAVHDERGEILLQRLVDGATSPEGRHSPGQASVASRGPVPQDARTGNIIGARTREQSIALLRMQLELPPDVIHKVC